MIQSHYRAANDRDLGAMTRGKGSLAHNVVAVVLPVSAVVFAISYFMGRSILISVMVAGAILGLSTISNVGFSREIRRRRSQRDDPRAVEVMEMHASRVIEIEHLGSHGPALCFFVGDRTALLLVGQWLKGHPNFPSTTFALHRWADDGKPIYIQTRTKRLTPEASSVRLKPEYRNGSIEVFDANPSTLQADLDRAFSP